MLSTPAVEYTLEIQGRYCSDTCSTQGTWLFACAWVQ